jgi:CspA family cold shock protein
MNDTNRETGKIIFFNEEKGFGFIKPDSPAQKDNIFLHKSNIKTVGVTAMEKDTEVEFDTQETDRGLAAFEVTVT